MFRKRFIATFLAVVMVLLLVPVNVHATDGWRTATPIAEGEIKTFTITARNHDEWFRFSAPYDNMTVSINIERVDGGQFDTGVFVRLFDGRTLRAGRTANRYNLTSILARNPHQLNHRLSEAGDYYFVVNARTGGDGQHLSPLQIQFTLLNPNAPAPLPTPEPTPQLPQPTPPPNQGISGFPFPAHDFMYVEITSSTQPTTGERTDTIGEWVMEHQLIYITRGTTLTFRATNRYYIDEEMLVVGKQNENREIQYILHWTTSDWSAWVGLPNHGWLTQNPTSVTFNEIGEFILEESSGGGLRSRFMVLIVTDGQQPTPPPTPQPTPEPTPPPVSGNIVQGFQCEAISVGVMLRWQHLAGGLGYRVFRSESPNEEGISITDFFITTNEFVDVNVRANTTYYYSVRQVIREARPFEGLPEELGAPTPKIRVTTGDITGDNLNPPCDTAQRQFILMTLDAPYMSVNGVIQEIDEGRGTVPIIHNNRTVVPMRAIVEAMGGRIGWQDATREISLSREQTNVVMWIDSFDMVVGGVQSTIDVPPAIINGRTMIPIRFAAENLDSAVDWLNSTRQIVIVFY